MSVSQRVWQWLNPRSKTPSRLRRKTEAHLRVAAQVESLEARSLLSVTYHGGPVLKTVELQNVYLGSDWTAMAGTRASLDDFASKIVNSTFMDTMTNAGYNVNRGTSSPGVVLNVTLSKNYLIPLTDSQIDGYLQAAITSKQLQNPDANRLYMVYVEPGVVINQGGADSIKTFLGYHLSFAGRTNTGGAVDVKYGVIAYPGAGGSKSNPTYWSQGFSSALDDLTDVSSHELAEACTDATPYKKLAWYDDFLNGEIADFSAFNREYLGPYLIQGIIGKNENQLIAATSLAAPTITSFSATSSTSAQLTWTSVPYAGQYLVFQVDGVGNKIGGPVAGPLSSATTSFNVTGLPAGATVHLIVEAVSTVDNYPIASGATADSAAVTLSLPIPLPAPSVGAFNVLSDSSVQLNWGAVPGVSGYRIYEKIGNQVFLVGVVSPSTTSLVVGGLTKGNTVQFMIEAFAGTSYGDSAWFDVTT